MKITTWNVNGLRAVFQKNALDWVHIEQPDALCLQEIKARPDQLDEASLLPFDAYQKIWHPAERPGYSGVATWLAQAVQEPRTGLGIPHYDQEGRVIITALDDFLLFNIYFPNGQRDHGRLSYKLSFYADLLELVKDLHASGEKVIICGDFNTAHNEIDLRNPKENQKTSGFMPEERAWIDTYLQHDLVDVYRSLYPERVQYSWWTYRMNARARNIGWRLDYFLVSQALMARVQDVIIHEDIFGSDHCPVSLLLA
jgi:exodeoxyribonuclease-3